LTVQEKVKVDQDLQATMLCEQHNTTDREAEGKWLLRDLRSFWIETLTGDSQLEDGGLSLKSRQAPHQVL
jgi:hypothetical protein